MCALNAWPRLNLPVAVFLNRFAAPRWLLSFGMILRFLPYDLLVLLRGARALLLLVLIAPEVHDAAHRRSGGRGDLDEVEAFLSRDGQRLRRRHDSQLCSILVDDADFTDPDAFVHPRAIV